LLELLKDDDNRYVQRSIANNLNDIGKDHPDIAVEVCRRWLVNAPAGRAWLVRHALRSLVKKGYKPALTALGVGGKAQVRVDNVRVAARVHIGAKFTFSFELTSTSKQQQELMIDYAVHFVKADGAARAKVFKLRRIVLDPRQRVALSGSVSFRDMTTRRHYAGKHRIDLLINGVARQLGEFAVHTRATSNSAR
jgi:hypothetical protein